MTDRTIPKPWQQLRELTPARIGTGRVGTSVSTADSLAFGVDHARARDAVHLPFDAQHLADVLAERGQQALIVRSAAADRREYLLRPDLGRHLDDWRVFDCRHDLAKPSLGEEQYRQGHIPGALFAHLDRDLSAPRDGRNGRHPLPYPGAFIAWLGQQGLEPHHQVVCYDGGGGTYAARLWWMLRWVGHDAVAVLDGGLAKWLAEQRPVTTLVPQVRHTTYPVGLRSESTVGIAFV